MRFNFKGDWRVLLLVGGFLLLLFVLAGALVSSIFGLFVWILRGIGTLLGSLLGFAFQSIFNLLIVVGIVYLGYKGYTYLSKKEETPRDTVDYSDEDFERGDGKNGW